MADCDDAGADFGRDAGRVAAAVAVDAPRTRGRGRASACCCRRRSAARWRTSRRRSPGKMSVNLNFTAGPRGDGRRDRAVRHHDHPHVAQVPREGGHRADRPAWCSSRTCSTASRRSRRRGCSRPRSLLPSWLLARLYAERGRRRVARDGHLLERQHRRAQGRDAHAIATSWRTSTRSAQIFQLTPDDVMVGVLPFFHSFGFTGTLWLPLVVGLRRRVPSQPDGRQDHRRDLAEQYHGDDPRQHADLLRGLHPQVHARAVRARALRAGRRREAARADRGGVQGEVRHHAARGLRLHRDVAGRRGQRARRRRSTASTSAASQAGTVGHPLPGVVAKVVDPDDRRRAAHRPATGCCWSTARTGCRATRRSRAHRRGAARRLVRDRRHRDIDEDGFIRITDRLSRFSKIAGEMVPHMKVEEEIQIAPRPAVLVRRDRGARRGARRAPGRVLHRSARSSRRRCGSGCARPNCRGCGCPSARTCASSKRSRRSAPARWTCAACGGSPPARPRRWRHDRRHPLPDRARARRGGRPRDCPRGRVRPRDRIAAPARRGRGDGARPSRCATRRFSIQRQSPAPVSPIPPKGGNYRIERERRRRDETLAEPATSLSDSRSFRLQAEEAEEPKRVARDPDRHAAGSSTSASSRS